QRLGIMLKTAPWGHLVVQGFFARMTERRVAEIMHQGNRLCEIFIAAQCPCECPGDLRNLDGMGQPFPIMIAFMSNEDLRLVLQPAKRRRMNDSVSVALEW